MRAFSSISYLSVTLLLLAQTANADSGAYIGAGAGGATLEADFDAGDPPIPDLPTSLDEDDTAFKVFGGYRFDLPLIDLGVEAGYVDFGEPEVDVLGDELTINTTGVNVWGTAGIGLGPVDLFAKLGYIFWDIEAELLGQAESDDGSDLGYGLGAEFGLGPVSIRGEYEIYDIDEFDLAMLSASVLFRF